MRSSRRARLDARERELLEQIQSLKHAYMAWVKSTAEELWLLRAHRDGMVVCMRDGTNFRYNGPPATYRLPEERH